ncbi:hypothetical protein Q8A67_013906 [Cirrhinus molitorella]|uniref:Uncharacterized protein n=1 Tax=Cirrhinus molitorella TaxID=172907 RepID=A0AA88PMI5_9TELE|nr:hypothetical protein Q8A67_013906 [Cirrhinus molitorella]
MSLRLERWMSLQAMTDAPKGKTDGSDSGSVRLWAVKLRNNGNNHSKKQKAFRHEARDGVRGHAYPGEKGRDAKLPGMIKSVSRRSAQAAIIRRSAPLPSISPTGEEQDRLEREQINATSRCAEEPGHRDTRGQSAQQLEVHFGGSPRRRRRKVAGNCLTLLVLHCLEVPQMLGGSSMACELDHGKCDECTSSSAHRLRLCQASMFSVKPSKAPVIFC